MVKDELKQQLLEVLKDFGIDHIDPVIEPPTDSKHGDYATNIALVVAKQAGQNPLMVGASIKAKLDERDIPYISNIEVVPPGFINFRISESYLLLQLPQIAKSDFKFPQSGKDRKVVVEYSSPNIAKPFTVGHLRSTIIGDAVANLLEATGWTVYRDNHIGDWGTQFGKQIYAVKTWGNEEEIEKSERPVKELVALYVKFHEEAEKDPKLEDEARGWFKKLEDGDEEARRLWQKCIDWSWKEFDKIYQELGVKLTENDGRGYGEAYFEDKMQPVIDELKEKGLLKKGEDGAQLVFFPDDKFPPLMILKKDGSTLYATRDLATDKFRLEKYGKDVVIINEVGVEQALYFQQLFALEEMLGWYKKNLPADRQGQRVHIKHGHFRFKEGKMSTRKGNVIWLEDVLAEAEKRAMSLGEGKEELKIANVVGIGAIKWNDLKRDSKQDIIFDWDDILNMQGNSGPYLQYVYVRTQSVIRRGKGQGARGKDSENLTLNPLPFTLNPEERELLRLLIQFGDVVSEAAERYAPNILSTYLFGLAQSFNVFYQKHPILKAEENKAVRLSLTTATGNVIKEGLRLLGIHTPESM